ncbi:MAG TPA: hypothetical protein VHG28_00665, partial [Longimicrobiaceae bacterium]|nr:hypothetical protein [Longimicrobiaceae bacterium]
AALALPTRTYPPRSVMIPAPGCNARRWAAALLLPVCAPASLAGIRHYRTPDGSVAAGLEIFRDDSLVPRPGTRDLYSSDGWNLLNAVGEEASGEGILP